MQWLLGMICVWVNMRDEGAPCRSSDKLIYHVSCVSCECAILQVCACASVLVCAFTSLYICTADDHSVQVRRDKGSVHGVGGAIEEIPHANKNTIVALAMCAGNAGWGCGCC